MIIAAGHEVMAETGFGGFSAREVARRIGYSIGTVYNLFETLDHLLVAINTRTIALWTDFVLRRLESGGSDRIALLVEAYFDFAREHAELWMAIYDHRLSPGMDLPERDAEVRRRLSSIVEREIAILLPGRDDADIRRLARSLIATVHGHCTFALNGSFELMGEPDPVGLALQRVRESIAAASPAEPPTRQPRSG
jgi:AcrR family transcriptional regulator